VAVEEVTNVLCDAPWAACPFSVAFLDQNFGSICDGESVYLLEIDVRAHKGSAKPKYLLPVGEHDARLLSAAATSHIIAGIHSIKDR
jgi:hypothetical protein